MGVFVLQEALNKGGEELDIETKAGMHFGVGSFNLVSSLLPPKVRSIRTIRNVRNDLSDLSLHSIPSATF